MTGIVDGLDRLNEYPWTGHSTVMGRVERDWQDTDTVLAYFGQRQKEAIKRYEGFIEDGISQGRRPELVRGGLLRSTGGWSEVLSLRRKGIKVASDQRVLGGSEFIQRLLSEAKEREKETLRLSLKLPDSVRNQEERCGKGKEGVLSAGGEGNRVFWGGGCSIP